MLSSNYKTCFRYINKLKIFYYRDESNLLSFTVIFTDLLMQKYTVNSRIAVPEYDDVRILP